jgi:hypothetical protein
LADCCECGDELPGSGAKELVMYADVDWINPNRQSVQRRAPAILSNRLSNYVRPGKFVDQLSDWKVLEKHCVPRSSLNCNVLTDVQRLFNWHTQQLKFLNRPSPSNSPRRTALVQNYRDLVTKCLYVILHATGL